MIPVNRPRIYPDLAIYIKHAIDSGWLSSEGPMVEEFEKKFARYIGAKYTTSTNSGTTALHLALLCLGIKKGDEVLVPALTIASCYFAVWYTGATAVPVDIDPETYTIDPKEIEKKITKRTRAIMPVHLYGHPCDMDQILKLAREYKLNVIEDAAEAHGAEYKERKVGGLGDIGCFSFYANKIVTCGEGGMITTNNKKYYELARKLKNLNHSKIRFIHDGVGYKYVMSNLQAAVGLCSLSHIEESLTYKKKMANFYQSHLQSIPGLILPIEKSWAKNVYWMYAVRIDPKQIHLSREKLMKKLRKRGIETRTFFYSPRTAFRKLGLFAAARFPIAEETEKTGFYLPSGLGNTQNEFKKVADGSSYDL